MATISIDLGTFNSAATYKMPNGEVVLLQPYHGQTLQGILIPSFLKFYANGELEKYGDPAYQALASVPQLVVWGLKRLIGKSYNNAKDEFFRFSYPIKEAEDGSITIPIGAKVYKPIELITEFLKKIKEDCESPYYNPIGSTINRAIITHPAYFDCGQIASIKGAAQKVGFEEVELISEPKAAALAYRDFIDFSIEPLIMVIDWGAGTLDITIERFSDKTGNNVVESAYPAYGDPKLGGMDMDDALVKKAKEIYGLSSSDGVTEGKLRLDIEQKKIKLSSEPWTQCFFSIGSKPYSFNFARSKENMPKGGEPGEWLVLEEAISSILQKFQHNILYSLEKAGLSPDEIDGLILVGGPMYMPCVRKAIGDVFKDNEKIIIQLDRIEKEGFPVKPLEAVVRGAILKDYAPSDPGTRLPHTHGFLLDGKIFPGLLIEENTIISGDKIVKEGKEFNCKEGHSMSISLYRKVVTSGVAEHFKKGDYRLTSITTSEKLPAYRPIIEVDRNQICTLKIIDVNTQDLSLKLEFRDEAETKFHKPIIEDISDLSVIRDELTKNYMSAGMSPEDALNEANKKIDDITKSFKGAVIPAEKVKDLIVESSNLIKFVEFQSEKKHPFQTDTVKLYEGLKQCLSSLIPDQPIKEATDKYNFHQVETRALMLKARLKNFEGFQI